MLFLLCFKKYLNLNKTMDFFSLIRQGELDEIKQLVEKDKTFCPSTGARCGS